MDLMADALAVLKALWGNRWGALSFPDVAPTAWLRVFAFWLGD
ncbi:MAG: hypothetical protein Q8N06_10960 [Hydrogenophaga sp.]|nr:hypothetical protein [Hydrogenophaga sp.]